MHTLARLRTALSASAVIDRLVDPAVDGTVNDTLFDNGLERPLASVVITARVCVPADNVGTGAVQVKAPAADAALQEAARRLAGEPSTTAVKLYELTT